MMPTTHWPSPLFHATRRLTVALLTLAVASGCLNEGIVKQPELSVVPGLPEGWSGTANAAGVGTTISDKRSGTTAAYLSTAFQSTTSTLVLSQFVRADTYRGKRVRISAWTKPRNIAGVSYSGVWMRVDGPGTILAFDNMAGRPVAGSGNWRQVSVVLDVPASAIGIALGALFYGTNTLLVDDMRFEVVGTDVPITNVPGPPAPAGRDSAAVVADYERSPAIPVNLDFEGIPPISAETASWITQNATTLETTDPAGSLDDLETLRAMVGTAHVVGLGEGTHGTREFFQLKHRILRFLVTRMGFTTFAIEATSPEADDLNAYVMTGNGDPARLLSHLYFWTWRTQELLDQILWMRTWNSTAPANQRVQFRGFDIQSPSASIDSVVAFLHRVDPARDGEVAGYFQCLEPYRNRGNQPGRPLAEYVLLRVEVKQACAQGLASALELVRTRGGASPGYQSALHQARLVQQFEVYAAAANAVLSNRVRDEAMAENVAWLRDQAGPDARFVLWAHNEHIRRRSGGMGGMLSSRFGADYRPVGFAFGTGRFNAVKQTGATLGTVESHDAQYTKPQSIESAFLNATAPLMLLDARRANEGGAAAAPLRGPIAMRSIGCCFDRDVESSYFPLVALPSDFDLLIFVRVGRATTLLEYVN